MERASVGVRERDGEGVRQRGREIDREREGGAARVRRSSPGMRSVEFPARPLRPAPSPPDRRQDSREGTRRGAHEGHAKTLRHWPASEVTAPPDQ